MRTSLTTLTGALLLAGSATATILSKGLMAAEPIGDPRLVHAKVSLQGSLTPSLKNGTQQGSFEQLIDHKNPSLGTFTQRYWWNDDYYKGPGSPVVLFNPGETSADGYQGYLTNRTITGAFMESNGAAGILLEHRFWGTSSPYDDLTVENLQLLTLENSIYDLIYFAKNVRAPFDTEGKSAPDKAPWVLSGCSYSGALTGWTNAIAPGTFWAYHGSSAVVEAIGDFWGYFDIVEQALPRNCSRDVKKVVKYVDKILDGDDQNAKLSLKKKFGLEGIEHDDDFASALLGGLDDWQGTGFSSGYGGFYQFCDYVENQWPGANQTAPGPEGVGLCKALNGYAKWAKEIMLPGSCASFGYWTDPLETACFDSHNASNPLYTDRTLGNAADRQWNWVLCNEPFEYWQGYHKGAKGNIASSLVSDKYWQDQCELYFPSRGQPVTYGINKGLTPADVNKYTGGWDHTNTTRFLWINGGLDPWRGTTLSSDQRPGGPVQSTEQVPIRVIPGAAHCSDLSLRNAQANPALMAIFNEEVAIIKGWVDEFYDTKGIKRPYTV